MNPISNLKGFLKKGQSSHWNKVFLFVFISLIGIIFLYGNVITFDYVWDDKLIFVQNNSLLKENLSWELISQPVLEGSPYFRPLVMLSWFLEFHYFGQNPVISHLINLVFFYINIILVFSLSLIFLKNRPHYYVASFIAGLIYLCHPMLIETSAWVSGRFDIFVTTFTLLAYIGFLKIHHKTLQILWFVAMTILALGSKELGILTPFGLYFIWMAVHFEKAQSFWQESKRFFKENKAILSASLVLIIAYLFIRTYTIRLADQPLSLGYIQYIFYNPLPILSLKEYLLRTILPFYNIGQLTPVPYFNVSSNIILSLVVCGLFLGTIIYLAIKKSKVVFLILSYGLFLSLVLHIIPISILGNLIQNRFLTLPMVFFAITVGYTLTCVQGQFYKYALFASFSYLSLITLISLQTIPTWRNDTTFWYATNQFHKEYSPFYLTNYFVTLIENKDNDKIEEFIAYERKVNNGSLRPVIQIAYGQFLMLNKDDPEGLDALEFLVSVMPPIENIHVVENDLDRKDLLGLYVYYGYGLLFFRNDIEKAKEMVDYGQKHFFPPNYYSFPDKIVQVTVELAANNMTAVKKILKDIKAHAHNNNYGQYIASSILFMLNKYCQKYQPDIPACQSDFNLLKLYESL